MNKEEKENNKIIVTVDIDKQSTEIECGAKDVLVGEFLTAVRGLFTAGFELVEKLINDLGDDVVAKTAAKSIMRREIKALEQEYLVDDNKSVKR